MLFRSYAIAESFAARGADVKIVSGPVKITTNTPNISVYNVKSASEMAQKTEELYADVCDIVVLCAAVADYTPQTRADGKIKRDGNNLSIDLVPTTDIAARLGQIKKDKTIHIGFALETDNEHTNACLKLKKKNLDMIVLNSLSDKGAGFSGDTNKITIYNRGGERFDYPLKSKAEVADDIVQSVEKLLLCSKG